MSTRVSMEVSNQFVSCGISPYTYGTYMDKRPTFIGVVYNPLILSTMDIPVGNGPA